MANEPIRALPVPEVHFMAEWLFLDAAMPHVGRCTELQPRVDLLRKQWLSFHKPTVPRETFETDEAFKQVNASMEARKEMYVAAWKVFHNALSELNEHAAQVCILCAAASEAFINRVIADHLPKSLARSIERLDPLGKWLSVPQLAGFRAFDAGKAPDQQLVEGAKRLFEARNDLMHFKPKKDKAPQENEYLPITEVEDSLNWKNAVDWYWTADGLMVAFYEHANAEPPDDFHTHRRHRMKWSFDAVAA